MTFAKPVRTSAAVDQAWSYIEESVPAKNHENVRGMRAKKDGSGVVFDVWEDKIERFTYAVEYIRERDGHVDFDILKCKALPELVEEEDFFGGGGS